MANGANRTTEVRKLLKNLTSGDKPHYLAEVVSVDKANRLAVVLHLQEGTTQEVRLQSALAEAGLLLIPKIGTWVLVAQLNSDGAGSIIQCEDLEEVQLLIGDSEMTFKDGLISFNGGEFKGLVKVEPTVDAFNDLQKEVSDLKLRLTTFETLFNSHTHVSAAPGVPTLIPAPPTSIGDGAPLIQTQVNDLANEKITH